MPLKTNPQAAAHYSSTYMEQLCKALHPDLEVGKVCVSWFRQAISHCADLLSDVRAPTPYFWTTMKSFIFPDRTFEIMSRKVPISIHPNRLSLRDCQSLLLDIASDYVQRIPLYAAESATNSMLWQVLYSAFGIMVLSLLFVVIAFTSHKYGQKKNTINITEEVLKPQRTMQYNAARSLQLAKTELRLLKVKREAKREDIIAADGHDTLVLKVGTKYEFLESLVQGCMYSEGKLHRLHDQHEKSKTEFKTQSLKNALEYIDNGGLKLHLVIMFEDNKSWEMEEAAGKLLKKCFSPPVKQSPRLLTSTPRQMINNRSEGGSALHKPLVGTTTSYRSPRLSTLKQQNTPRSTNTSSGIPRNVQKAALSARKSN